MRPRLLDLFCGAGGAAMGYHRAGFEVVGVDLDKQPNYPFEFHRENALAVLYEDVWPHRARSGARMLRTAFDAIHASPPCQSFTAYRRRGDGVGDGYEDLVEATRNLLRASGLPYVIENVEGSPVQSTVTLCGSMFGLEVKRHRLFESNIAMLQPECRHDLFDGSWPQATNRTNRRRTCEVGVWRIPLEDQKRAMGVNWDCTLRELSNMVPPAYTEWIGTQVLATLAESSPNTGPKEGD